MPKPNLKELRSALKVLESLDTEVPERIFVAISDLIRQREERNHTNKINRLSEEDLIRLDNFVPRRLRVTTSSGRIVHHRRNVLTFHSALQLLTMEQLAGIDIQVRRHAVFIIDPSQQRRVLRGYKLLMPGVFVYSRLVVSEMVDVLQHIDRRLELDWDVDTV